MPDATATASPSGVFEIGGDLPVTRLGFGAMRLTGEGVWGPPKDREGALAVLRRAVELGVTLVDTADSYGPHVSEELIGEALAPYRDDVVVATKAGLVRPGPGDWRPVGRPEYLRQQLHTSLRRLRTDVVDLWQLHRIDPAVDAAEQFGVLKEMKDAGLVRHVGLSEVSVAELDAAREVVDVATVQNRYNLTDRGSQAVLERCQELGVGFLPWFPVASGELARPGGPVDDVAARTGGTPAQVALAWLLRTSEVMLPIPGTSSVAHLEENCAAAGLELSDEDVAELDAAAS